MEVKNLEKILWRIMKRNEFDMIKMMNLYPRFLLPEIISSMMIISRTQSRLSASFASSIVSSTIIPNEAYEVIIILVYFLKCKPHKKHMFIHMNTESLYKISPSFCQDDKRLPAIGKEVYSSSSSMELS